MDGLYLRLFGALFFIVIGFAGRRIDILNEKRVKWITWLTANILFPCLLFYTVYAHFRISLITDAALLFLIAITISILSYFLGRIFSGLLNLEDRLRRVFLLLSFKPATGLIGMPLCVILLGEESLFYAGPYAFAIGLVFYTLGLGVLKKGGFSLAAFVNPICISIALSFLLLIFRIDAAPLILKTARTLGMFAVPMALIIVGSIFGLLKLRKDMIERKMFLVAFTKLIFSPLVVFLFCAFLPLEPLGKKAALLMAATPSSVTASMWALRYDADYLWASSAALFVGMLSIFSVSLITSLVFLFFP